MRLARPPRRALGLRGRIVGVVLFTAVATLAVAAVALLRPLESSLRNATLNSLTGDLVRFQRHRGPLQPQFVAARFARLGGRYPARVELADLPFAGFAPGPVAAGAPAPAPHGLLQEQGVIGTQAARRLHTILDALSTTVGGGAYLFAHPGMDGDAVPIARSVSRPPGQGGLGYVRSALVRGRPAHSFATIDGTDYLLYAVPFRLYGVSYALAIERAAADITTSAHAVQRAFLYAALAGLALTLLFAIPLSARLARRLRRLRQAALRIAADARSARVPDDRTQDEVGDLSRSLATMQRRLEHQEEARRAFVATASHELRTPLTSLEGMLELLDEDLADEQPDLSDARELLRSARAQSRRLARLAADLLDLSRLDAEVALRSEPVELSELARAVLAEFQHGSRARGGVGTAMRGPGEPVWALGDPGSIARILRILLDNAVRVSPEGGEVTVQLRAAPRPGLIVSDQGPGVDPQERDLIFERFHRGRATAGDAGFGLGLAIGRELAERMGGSLSLEPPSEGGAVFTLSLQPIAAPARAGAGELLPSAGT
jgi:signal transduction histidine kinase